MQIKVLNDGFVRVVDTMGDDSAIVQAARISYGAGTKKTSEDRGLIRYLMRHRHTTPFEMCEIKLHVRVPMDCWRQWIRHRTANVNEYSTRYSEAIDAMQTTSDGEWRTQSTSKIRLNCSGIISDTGIGMTPEQLSRIFSPFTQADDSTTRRYGGTGLGLAITQEFCQIMGGTIEVESKPNQGAVFTIRVPLTAVSTPNTNTIHLN